MNYYQVLGVDNNAEQIIIRAAYKTLIQKYHPDKAKSPKEADDFLLKTKEINEAYSTLSDEKLRSIYDEELKRKNQKYNDDVYDPTKKLPRGGFGFFGKLMIFVLFISSSILIYKFQIKKTTNWVKIPQTEYFIDESSMTNTGSGEKIFEYWVKNPETKDINNETIQAITKELLDCKNRKFKMIYITEIKSGINRGGIGLNSGFEEILPGSIQEKFLHHICRWYRF
jgi:curved DNA-binding protein CbpA